MAPHPSLPIVDAPEAPEPPEISVEAAAKWLRAAGPKRIACSGGIDSLLLATLSHRVDPERTRVTHALGPAVPGEATERVRAWGAAEGWSLEWAHAGEAEDERYVSNPSDRCYFCKDNLYRTLRTLERPGEAATLLSGANVDDLGEWRPGLNAAEQHRVRHPWVEMGWRKADIRELARTLELPFAELPASPCLASRLYTGTRVTPERLAAVEAGEERLRALTGIAVARCRIEGDRARVEVGSGDRARVTERVLSDIASVMRRHIPELSLELDPRPYAPGRAFSVNWAEPRPL